MNDTRFVILENFVSWMKIEKNHVTDLYDPIFVKDKIMCVYLHVFIYACIAKKKIWKDMC